MPELPESMMRYADMLDKKMPEHSRDRIVLALWATGGNGRAAKKMLGSPWKCDCCVKQDNEPAMEGWSIPNSCWLCQNCFDAGFIPGKFGRGWDNPAAEEAAAADAEEPEQAPAPKTSILYQSQFEAIYDSDDDLWLEACDVKAVLNSLQSHGCEIDSAQLRVFGTDFRRFDTNKDGHIDAHELQALVAHQLGRTPSADECTQLMSQMDFDGDGDITFVEYVRYLHLKGSQIIKAKHVESTRPPSRAQTKTKDTKAEKRTRQQQIAKAHRGSTFYLDLDAQKESAASSTGKKKGNTLAQSMAQQATEEVISLTMAVGDALVLYEPQNEGFRHPDVVLSCSVADEAVVAEDTGSTKGVKLVALVEGSTIVDVKIAVETFGGGLDWCFHEVCGEMEAMSRWDCEEHKDVSDSEIEIPEGCCKHGQTKPDECEECEFPGDDVGDEMGLPIEFQVHVQVESREHLKGMKNYFQWDGQTFASRADALTKPRINYGTRMLGFVNGRSDFSLVRRFQFDLDGCLMFG